jgi:hypothetical protein
MTHFVSYNLNKNATSLKCRELVAATLCVPASQLFVEFGQQYHLDP